MLFERLDFWNLFSNLFSFLTDIGLLKTSRLASIFASSKLILPFGIVSSFLK